MIETLAEVLSYIDDQKTIEKMLKMTQGDGQLVEQSPSQTEGKALQELYERFLTRRQNRSPATRAQYRRALLDFIAFAEYRGVTTTRDVSTEIVDSYVDTLQKRYGADATILTYTKNVRGWLRWLNERGQCSEVVYRILDKDGLGLSPRARDEALPASKATTILKRLRQQRQGSLIHVLIELLWNGGLRIGGVHSLDVCDFDPNNSEIQLRHRPESETRLKNGSENEDTTGDGERNIELKESVIQAIAVYLNDERPSVVDDHGREPLFATQRGRATRSTLRRKVYEGTSCRWAQEDTDSQSCDGNCDPDADVCQYSYYPHAIRRGAIVHHLSGGLPPSIASERFDVSIQTLRKHYDPRTKRKRREDRSDAVRESWWD